MEVLTDHLENVHVSFNAQNLKGEWCFYTLSIPSRDYNVEYAKRLVIRDMDHKYRSWDHKPTGEN